VLLRAGPDLYSVDEQGSYYGWSGAFSAGKPSEPYLRLVAPDPTESLTGVYRTDGDGEDLLAVFSRKHQRARPPFDEVYRAAERFLPGEVFERLKAKLDMMASDTYRDDLIERERKEKGLEHAPQTETEWKSVLPNSYADVLKWRRTTFVTSAMNNMEMGLNPKTRFVTGLDAGDPRLEQMKAWLAQLDLPAETTLAVFRRGARLATARFEGYVAPSSGSRLQRVRVPFRTRGNETTAVLALGTGESPKERATLVIVRIGGGD
jgi:hypothetical protein